MTPREESWREKAWSRSITGEFDLVVVGGGITGAGIFRDAAARGIRVALVEQGDFASGTSSKSSKLVHGGLRYLENFEFGLVHESTTERTRLERLAAHLVRPLPFLMPVWKGSKHPLWFLDLGLYVYDALRWFRGDPIHRRLPAKDLVREAPGIRTDRLAGGLRYYDAVTDDTRLTLENVLDAVALGGIALSRVRAVGSRFQGNRVEALEVEDLLEPGRKGVLRTRAVIVAAGPWTEATDAALGVRDGPRLRPTKGIHLVFPRSRLPLEQAVVATTPQDGRVFFVIPWHDATIVGTTDTDDPEDPARVVATTADVEYLMTALKHHFPELPLETGDILGTWAGLRPLLREEGVSASKVSREHSIHVDPRGIVTIAGGKLTTYRLMARECLEAARGFLPSPLPPWAVEDRPLFYRGAITDDQSRQEEILRLQRLHRLEPAVARHLVHAYGGLAEEVLALASEDPSLANPLAPPWPMLEAEVVWAVRREMALTLEDVLTRRNLLFYLAGPSLETPARRAAQRMAVELGWDPDRTEREVTDLLDLQARHLAGVRGTASPA